MRIVTKEMLTVLAQETSAPPRGEGRTRTPGSANGGREFDLSRWIEEHEVPVKREGEWGGGGYRYILEECPWNGHTDNSAYIVQGRDGWIAAGCHHNSCQEYGWQQMREHYEPGHHGDQPPVEHLDDNDVADRPQNATLVG